MSCARLVVQEWGFGERRYELFAVTLSLTIVKLLPSAVGERHLSLMLVVVRCVCVCVFLYGSIRRHVVTELPCQDPRCGNGRTIAQLRKARYITRGASQPTR